MCGVCAVVTKQQKQTKQNINIFKSLLIENESRGVDSTGIFYNGVTDKDILPAHKFIQTIEDQDLKTSPYLIGHTRFATHGTVNQKNAHPFTFGEVTGVHNGVLENHAKYYQGEVDSETIFYLLNKYKNNYKKVFKKLEGSYTVIWKYQENIHVIRHENPLALAISENNLYMSSEFYPLLSHMTHAGIQYERVYEIEEDTVYTITPDLTISKEKVKTKKKKWTYDYNKKYSNYGTNTYYGDEGWYDDKEDLMLDTEDEAGFRYAMEYGGCVNCTVQVDFGYFDKINSEAYCINCYDTLRRKVKDQCIYVELPESFMTDEKAEAKAEEYMSIADEEALQKEILDIEEKEMAKVSLSLEEFTKGNNNSVN